MKKPSDIKLIKAKFTKLLPSSFAAITLFGVVYSNRKSTVEMINKSDLFDSSTEVHEMIHVKQACSTKDSWLLFYLTYICEWLFNLPLIFVNVMAPYKFMPMELDAYGNQNDPIYAMGVECNMWRRYKKISLKERFKLSRLWYGSKKDYDYSFTRFIKEEVNKVF